VADTVTIPTAAEESGPRDRRWLRWPLLIVVFIALVWLLGVAITLLIGHTRLHERLTHRLESVFGRHVEVGYYEFSLWSGPTLTADSVTFSEDPRFGHEYFLRADSVRVRLHWQSLFRGRMDLGTVTLDRPSLNLVRNANGDWNLGEWLPRITNEGTGAATSITSTSAAPRPYVRFDRIRFDDGRINFKRADEKVPFAFVGVGGSVEPDSPGRWRIDLEAIPTRAAVPMQQPGLIHVAAQVGGTSSRFRPANVALSWSEGSVSDLLRLTRGNDFGIRGDFALAIDAHAETDDWQLETRTQFRALHRWDMTPRPDNPDFNVLAEFAVHPQATGFDVEHATIEAPHSTAEAAAHISWNAASNPMAAFSSQAPAAGPAQLTEIRITNSRIDFADVLAWIRAFHSDVAPDAALTGYAAGTATLAANPPRLTTADIRTTNLALTSSALAAPARLTPITIRYDKDSVSLEQPATLTFGDLASALHLDSTRAAPRDAATFHAAGSVTQVRDLVTAAATLGWPVSRGWAVTGPARFDLRWPASGVTPWKLPAEGTVDWGEANATAGVAASDAAASREATLLAPFLNEPVRGIRAHVELRQGARRITLASADAFDARWSGTLERHEAATDGWQFALSADKLSTSAVDRWLNPRWRQSFLDRVFGSSSSSAVATPEVLRASGRLTIDQLTVAPLVARHVQGELAVNGRSFEFKDASAQLATGTVNGTVRAALSALPEYHVKMNFAGVDLSSLTDGIPSLAGQFDGAASGEITLASHGGERNDLVAALACEGNAHIANAQLKQINLDASLKQGELRTGSETFRDATAEFTCSDGAIDVRRVIFTGANGRIEADGSIDFSRALDFTFANSAAPAASYQLTGTLASPSLAKASKP
jgi:AsmA-like C-terminal region/AsmA family